MSMFGLNVFTQMADPSMVSFANPVDTIEDMDEPMDVLFYNEALLNLLETTELDLETELDKKNIVNLEMGKTMSLRNAAQNRYSNVVLNQIHKIHSEQ